MGLADKTVRLAVDIAAAVVLAEHDRNMAKLAALEAQIAVWGKKEPEVIWETERELD